MTDYCAHCGQPRRGYGGVPGGSVCHSSDEGWPDCYRRVTAYHEPLGALRGVDQLPSGVCDIRAALKEKTP